MNQIQLVNYDYKELVSEMIKDNIQIDLFLGVKSKMATKEDLQAEQDLMKFKMIESLLIKK